MSFVVSPALTLIQVFRSVVYWHISLSKEQGKNKIEMNLEPVTCDMIEAFMQS